MKIRFPSVELADENGIVYVGGELTVENLLSAYSQGIFPWPHKNLPLLWFSPEERGVLPLSQFSLPHSTRKQLKKMNYEITFDRCFSQVIEECALQPRSGQRGTWITAEMQKIYEQMFQQGYAHSVECWLKGELVGGLYGVYVQGVFSGESMFFKKPNASKKCVEALVQKLLKMGHQWFDIQMVTPVLEHLGGCYINRQEYIQWLKQAQKNNLLWRANED